MRLKTEYKPPLKCSDLTLPLRNKQSHRLRADSFAVVFFLNDDAKSVLILLIEKDFRIYPPYL